MRYIYLQKFLPNPIFPLQGRWFIHFRVRNNVFILTGQMSSQCYDLTGHLAKFGGQNMFDYAILLWLENTEMNTLMITCEYLHHSEVIPGIRQGWGPT